MSSKPSASASANGDSRVSVVVPSLGESVVEAAVARWIKSVGDKVAEGEPLVELETDKANVEIPSPASGALRSIDADADAVVKVGATIGAVEIGRKTEKNAPTPQETTQETPAASPTPATPATPAPQETTAASPTPTSPTPTPASSTSATSASLMSPSARKLAAEGGLDPDRVVGSGRDGRVTKGDVLSLLRTPSSPPSEVDVPSFPPVVSESVSSEREERIPMTRLRRAVARRLKEAQNVAAMLTTFNEIDMTDVSALRSRWKDDFLRRHGVKLGFMSFFAKACVSGLREFPSVNAEIDGDDVVYKNYYHLGVAVGAPRGLVVPVLRDVDRMSFAEIERGISDFSDSAKRGALKPDDLTGGTFTISNGGVYGSMLSTPILNSPQSGILGMHAITRRPMAVGDRIEIRPMMYVALTYDHRLVDGREAVGFLSHVKASVEEASRMMLEL